MLMLFYQPLTFRKLKSILTESLNDDSCVHLGMFREMLFYQPLSFRKLKSIFTESLNDDSCVHLGMFREMLFHTASHI